MKEKEEGRKGGREESRREEENYCRTKTKERKEVQRRKVGRKRKKEK